MNPSEQYSAADSARRYRLYERLLPPLALLGSIGTVVVAENLPRIAQAAAAIYSYSDPAPGDMMPDLTSCSPRLEPAKPLFPFIHQANGELPKVKDPIKEAATSDRSAVHSFPLDAPTGYIHSEPLISTDSFYFDRHVQSFMSSIGLTFEVYGSTENQSFHIDPDAVDTVLADIFKKLDVYRQDDVKSFLQCRYNQLFKERALDGTTVNTYIIPDGDKEFSGNNVVTHAAGYKSDSPTVGLGVSGVGVSILGIELVPESVMIVAGGNQSLKSDHDILQKRFLHELLHVLLFDDVIGTIKEVDEQEALVDYITKSLYGYYKATNTLPSMVVTS